MIVESKLLHSIAIITVAQRDVAADAERDGRPTRGQGPVALNQRDGWNLVKDICHHSLVCIRGGASSHSGRCRSHIGTEALI